MHRDVRARVCVCKRALYLFVFLCNYTRGETLAKMTGVCVCVRGGEGGGGGAKAVPA